jgi:hypothetical protein
MAFAAFDAVAARAYAQIELPTAGQPLVFDLNGIEAPAGGHLQGIQMGPADGQSTYKQVRHLDYTEDTRDG